MAQYAVLLYVNSSFDPDTLSAEDHAEHDRHGDDVARFGGTMLTAFELEASSTATAIRGDAMTDGPFLDAKEVVAGFYVIEAPDLDAALEIARRNPAARQGAGVEVRPVRGGFVGAPTGG